MRLLASCFQASGRRRYQQFRFFWLHHGQIFSVHKNSDSSFFFFCQAELITPIRNCSVDTELIDRVNCLEQEFCICKISIEVNGTSAFPLLQDSTTQSNVAFEDKMNSLFDSLYHHVGGAILMSFLIDPGSRNVQCPGKNFMAKFLASSAFEIQFSSFFPHNVIEH